MSLIASLPIAVVHELTVDKAMDYIEIDLCRWQDLVDSDHLVLEFSAATTADCSAYVHIRINGIDQPQKYWCSSLSPRRGRLAHLYEAAGFVSSGMKGPDLCNNRDGYSFGSVFLPWFKDDYRDHVAIVHGVSPLGDLCRRTAAFSSRGPVRELRLTVSHGAWAPGSVIRVLRVREDRLAAFSRADSEGNLSVDIRSLGANAAFFISAVRSAFSATPYARQHRGDRLYFDVGAGSDIKYAYQRLSGEGVAAPTFFGLPIPEGRVRHFVERRRNRQFSCIQDDCGEERRFAWVPNAEGPESRFGVSLIVFPHAASGVSDVPWCSFHGANDGAWNPVGSECGVVSGIGAARNFAVFPRGGPGSQGAPSAPGSKIAAYRLESKTSLAVENSAQTSISVAVPKGIGRFGVSISARSEVNGAADELVITIDGDHEERHYRCERTFGAGGTHGVNRSVGRRLFTLPTRSSDQAVFGSYLVTFATCDLKDRPLAIVGFGNCGASRIEFSGGTYVKNSPPAVLTISTRSGEPFSAGTVVATLALD